MRELPGAADTALTPFGALDPGTCTLCCVALRPNIRDLNRIARAIDESPFALADFSREVEDWGVTIGYRPLQQYRDDAALVVKPGAYSNDKDLLVVEWGNRKGQVSGQALHNSTQEWLDWVRRQVVQERWRASRYEAGDDEPDLWAELQQEREVLVAAAAPGAENTPFTPAEQSAIAERLSEIEEDIEETNDLSPDQEQALNAAIAELTAAAGRLGRRDWFGLAVGTLTILEAILPPGSIRHSFLMLFHGLVHLRGFPELPSG